MYYKLDVGEFAKIREVEKITCTDYDLSGDFIPVENMMAAIEDLLIEIGRLEERYEDLEQNINDNYRPIPQAEMYGISEREFI